MIDFPASPTVGQLFTAPNGVIYQWNGTIWVTSSAGGTGQVQATGGTFTPAVGTNVVIVFPTVVSGNAGNWLNTTTGRYTPPAGSYFLQCSNGVQAPTGGNGTWTLVARKNGVQIPGGTQSSGSALFSIGLTVGVYVDANGTDYFDFVANCAAAGMAAQGGQFTAFPLSGLQGPPGPTGISSGDFWSYNSATIGSLTAGINNPIKTDVVGTGNSGSWYSTGTGRFTPPAGRYYIFATCSASAGAAVQFTLNLRKNGVVLPGALSWQTPSNSGYWQTAQIGATLDANGTDYFDLTINPNTAGTTANVLNFGAFSTQVGPKGPTGDAGAFGTGFRQITSIAASAVAAIDVTALPADINHVMVNFDVAPSVNDVDLVLQFYDASGLLDATTTHYLWGNSLTWSTATGGAPLQATSSSSTSYSSGVLLNWSAASGRVSNAAGTSMKGDFRLANIRDTTKQKSVNFASTSQAGNNAYVSATTGGGTRQVVGAITGFRLSWTGGANFTVPGNVTVWGSP